MRVRLFLFGEMDARRCIFQTDNKLIYGTLICMTRSQRYLKFANLALLIFGSIIAIVDIFSFVLLIVPDLLKLDVFIGWFRFYPVLTDYIFPISLFGIIVTLVSYFSIIITYAWFTKEKPNMQFGSISISVIVFVNVLLCPFSFAFLLIQPSYSMFQSTKLDNHTYHLYVTTYHAAEYYHISKCDSLDFICKEVYSASQYSLKQKVGSFEDGSVSLIPDPAARTVTLQINGEPVYVHEVK